MVCSNIWKVYFYGLQCQWSQLLKSRGGISKRNLPPLKWSFTLIGNSSQTKVCPITCCCYVSSSHLQLMVISSIIDLQNVISSTALLSCCELSVVASFMESIYFIFGLPLFLLLSTFPSIIVFSREFCLLKILATSSFLLEM